jgi:large subunit ribosomal protein L9
MAISTASIPVEKREVRLPPEGALRRIGDHSITLHLHTEIIASLVIVLEAE